jgi:hypothetical protein
VSELVTCVRLDASVVAGLVVRWGWRRAGIDRPTCVELAAVEVRDQLTRE